MERGYGRKVLVADVPLNTSLADLDEALRTLLKRELERHGFDGVEIAFDAPSREWSGKLTGPTVSVFLYDLREAAGQSGVSADERRGSNGRVEIGSPDMRLEATYAVTAWSKAVEDEHRLLSQVLSILFTHKSLPEDVLGRLAGAGTIETSVGRPMEEKADFWSAVGGQYKPSIDFAVRMSIVSGAFFVRGPEVRTQTLQTRLLDAPRGTMSEMHRFGGVVLDGDGKPVHDAWVALPELGTWTSSDKEGRYIFDRVPEGSVKVRVRTVDGRGAERTLKIPGKDTDLVLGASNGRSKKSGG